ncbi:MAG: ABC transporter permease [Anaerolineae bacterium]|nr:ABC transporter permease [Anaerolineae bacterium]
MQATIDKRENIDVNPLVTYLTLGLGILAFAVAALILLGWLPLGERVDILRSNKNWIEYAVIILSLIYGIAALRTFSGLSQREKAGLAWARWLTFITIFIGLALILSVIIPTYIKLLSIPAPSEGVNITELRVADSGLLLMFIASIGIVYQLSMNADLLRFVGKLPAIRIRYSLILFLLGFLIATPAGLLWVSQFPNATSNIRTPEAIRLLPGLLLFVLPLFAYLSVRHGEEESDHLRRAISLPPHKFLQTQLATSPSAGALIGFLAIFMAFTMATDLFLRPTSIASILTNVSSKGVIAIGVTILMISGEFDLSVGSILGVVAMTFMAAMTVGDPIFGLIMSPLPAAFYAIFIGALLGFFNGFILVTTRIPSFIVTLGTMLLFRSFVLVGIAGGRILRYSDHHDALPITVLSQWFFVVLALIGLAILAYTAYRVLPTLWQRVIHNWSVRADNGDFGTASTLVSGVIAVSVSVILALAGLWLVSITLFHMGGETIQVGFFDIVNGRWDGSMLLGGEGFSFEVPRDANFRMAIVWWFILVLFFHVILTSTSYGNSVFAVGGNEGAARAQGINVNFVKVFNFVLVATLTGIAAIYETTRNPGVDPLKGDGWELQVIAMTVIGGALLSGGYGSIIGSLLGALIVGMVQTGLVLSGAPSRAFAGVVGAIIIIAVILNTAVRGRQGN